ncbi:hypothetical protein BJ138DRAFT_935448 [Hygrophoropsis aurantiaca]|uniref:Uncharacterized protein n=1 Tax=Hygrophoropsis aurantiaca TaxID=72124 RepID=A0ACB7ZTA0_9AGAM|nr:hypothetical protein BJ138DRAFT_935448 [Hygrophoropsis aurantiaca]
MEAIRAPSWACECLSLDAKILQQIPWMCEKDNLIISRLSKLPLTLLKRSIRRVHPSVRPYVFGSTKTDFARALSSYVRSYTSFLLTSDDVTFYSHVFSVDSDMSVNLESRMDFVISMFQSLFGADVMAVFSHGSLDCHQLIKQNKDSVKAALLNEKKLLNADFVTFWPQRAPRDTVFSCMHQYFQGTLWNKGLTCAETKRLLILSKTFTWTLFVFKMNSL